MSEPIHKTLAELESGMEEILRSPMDDGVLKLIVRRPQTGEREILPAAELDVSEGLIGDNWITRGNSSTPPQPPKLDMQLTVMNSRVIALLAREKNRWPLAGDQLFVDLNLSVETMPPGTQLGVGAAIIEITAPPHTGCKKFMARFGPDAVQFVNSPVGKQLRLRGLNARVVRSGVIRVGDKAKRLSK